MILDKKPAGTLLCAAFLLAVPLSGLAAECLSIDEAPKNLDKLACVTGKVLKVGESRAAHYLNFCDDYRRCPFSVVVFKNDIKDAKMLEKFAGKTIRIYGYIQEYRGRPEMILRDEQQLTGEPGPYADKLVPRQKRDRRAPAPPGAGLPPS